MPASEFFNVQTVEAALALLFDLWQPQPRMSTIPTAQANGRVLARAPTSSIDLPEFPRSSMDGYAVRAVDTFGASASLPAYVQVVGRVQMGETPDLNLRAGEAAEIFTGAMLPRGADAVVMVEHTQQSGANEIEVLSPVAPGENVIQIGEDVRAGEAILPVGHRLRPQDIGGLLAVGILSIEVAAAPRVAIVGSGDEIVPPEQTPGPGQIRDINSYTLAALFEAAGAEVRLGGVSGDTFDSLHTLAQACLTDADVLVISAGSSISTRDLTSAVIDRLGRPGVIQHGLAVKPGKPTLIGLCDGKPVIGLPGNPVSAFLVARQIVLPVIRRVLGLTDVPMPAVRAVLSANIASTTGREDTIPVRLRREGEGWSAQPVFGKSNLIYTLVNADGVVVVPLNSGGLKAGTMIDVVVFS
ncbi:MAG: molybdopterin molybdotransferase MoeA [Chloroflexi bacterium]|nr:molybdopterin molybdotransferase MoeA [Chloroflexota bacterium]